MHMRALACGAAALAAPSAVRAFVAPSMPVARHRCASTSPAGLRPLAMPRQRGQGGRAAIKLNVSEQDLDEQESEEQRAERMNGINAEVDAIQRQLGVPVDDDEEEEREIEVTDTRWSGQAGLEQTVVGGRTWGDMATRYVLVVGDVAALVLFAYIGRSSHGNTGVDLEVLKTALPFVAGWVAASPLLGAYTNKATATQGEMAKTLVGAWAVSVPMGIALRGVVKGEVPPVPFIGVSMVATFVLLLAWRALYTAVNPTSTAEFKSGGVLDAFRMLTTLVQRW